MTSFKVLKQNLSKAGTAALPQLRVALLGDTATQFLAIALQGVAIERGYRLDIFEAEYNQVEQQFLDPCSALYTFHADYTLVFQSSHKLLTAYNRLPLEE
jgi:predicted enzyme involved in methoxymalonyl-ACP biosynthesis